MRICTTVIIYLIAVFSGSVFAQTFTELEQKVQALSDPAEQLAVMVSAKPLLAREDLEQQAKYWYLLGTIQERNQLQLEAINAYNQAITLSKAYYQGPSVLEVESLMERAYIKYLRSYDTQVYCPDRKLALVLARQLTQPKLLVKVLVRYAFCFKDQEKDLTTGLALLDEAIIIAKQSHLSARDHAMIHNASGLLYRNNHVYDKAYDFLNKAYQQWASVDDYQDMFNMQHSLVHTAVDMKRFDLAGKHLDTLFYLAKHHKTFPDFEFFSYYNAGFLAFQQGKFKESIAKLQLALSLQDTTNEKYFVRISSELLIISYFRLNRIADVKELFEIYRQRFPTHKIDNLEILAIAEFVGNNYVASAELFYQALNLEVNKRRDFVQRSTLVNASLFNVNITELDNKILQQELEINTLQFEREQSKKRNAYMSLVLVSSFAFALILFSWYLLRTRRIFRARAQTDFLTRIANRRHSFEQGQYLLAEANLSNQPLSLVIFDIDHFKQVNDTLGHECGDQAIIAVVAKSKECLRKQDQLGRIGGEEFLLLLPDTALDKATEIAERIRSKVATAKAGDEPDIISLTVSLGVVAAQGEKDLQALINRADKALYQAKADGRNRTVVA